MERLHVVVAGNLVEDQEAGGGRVPGGPALYAARMAHALGARVTLLTQLPRDYPAAALDGLDLRAEPVDSACRYANTYDAAGKRTQMLLAPGRPLNVALRPGDLIDALIIAPAYHEFATRPPIDARVVMVCLQGLLRDTDDAGRVFPARDPLARVASFIEPGAFACLSDEDTADPESLARELAAGRMTVALTRGERGVTLFEGAYRRDIAAFPAEPIDPTGAGDCFASAWTVRFAETGDLAAACAFALAAGALATERPGLAGVASRAEVERRIAWAGDRSVVA